MTDVPLKCLTCPNRQEVISENAHLKIAMEHRGYIDMAKGILMAERRITSQQAFALLKQISNDTNTKLYEVARELVKQVESQCG